MAKEGSVSGKCVEMGGSRLFIAIAGEAVGALRVEHK